MPDDEVKKTAAGRLGQVLRGKYRLDRVLGIGGMATVYAATHRNKKRFAIKMLHPELSKREDIRTRFLREGYVANSVDHSGAVAVLDDDVAEDGSAFLVMELLEGVAVDEAAAKHEGHRMPLSIVLSIGGALLEVLAAAHAKRIVHRDLKPANLFLTNDGRLEVLDFGIARLHDETSSSRDATQTGVMLGTPAFMAPEQALAESSKIDAQTDLWAAGATLFTLLSGVLVHEGNNASQLMIRAATSKARALASVAPEVPKAIAEVIDRAIAFEKEDRWASALAMREALARACGEATGAPIGALPVTERVTGLEETATSDASLAPGGSGVGFDPTIDASAPGTLGTPAPPSARGAAATGASPLMTTRTRWLAGLVVLVAGGLVSIRRVPPVNTTGPAASEKTAAPQATTLADLPLPASSVPEAITELRAGLQLIRDDSFERAIGHYERATQLDPAMASAHLRLALTESNTQRDAARVEFAKSAALRAQLSDHDRVLLDSLEPSVGRVRPDRLETVRRLSEASARAPLDVELLDVLASSELPDPEVAAITARKAVALDPLDARAFDSIGTALAWSGDLNGARQAFERCAAISVESSDCLYALALLDGAEGRCDAMETHARRAADLEAGMGNRALTWALTALDRPEATIRDAWERSLAGSSTETVAVGRAHLDTIFAARAGRFDLARQSLDIEERMTAASPSLRVSWERSLGLVEQRVALLRETGDAAHVREAAGAFVDRVDTLTRPTGLNFGSRWPWWAWAAAGRPLDPERTAWVDEQLGKGVRLASTWLSAWAEPAETPDEARAALDALAHNSLLTLPKGGEAMRWTLPDAIAGHTQLLAGHFAAALPYLRRASASCYVRGGAFAHVRIELDLGRALEAGGDTSGACAAYDEVISRWGHATPRSVSAEAAREALKRLRCAKDAH